MLKRTAFQVHLWCGVALGAYAGLIGLSGALLMFRPELQAWAYPQLFPPLASSTPAASPDAVVEDLLARFPAEHLSGIDYPTFRRGTFLVYLTRDDEFRAVFFDAAMGRYVGELPKSGWIQQLQELHFHLWSGRIGLALNGACGLVLTVMVATGAVIGWPGRRGWHRALVIDPNRGWRRMTGDIHRAVGVCSSLFLAMWACTGFHFAYPAPLRTLVDIVTPTHPMTTSAPIAASVGDDRPPDLAGLVARARDQWPSATVARVLIAPAGGAYTVTLARGVHGDWDSSDEVTYRFDAQGTLTRIEDARNRPLDERLLSWPGILHVGIFGGWVVKLLWAALGLALPTLFVSGYVMWWNRVVRKASG